MTLNQRFLNHPLSLTPSHSGPSPKVHYATTAAVSEADPVVDDLDAFRTKEPTLYFRAFDTMGNHASGEPKRWVAKLKVRYQVREYSDHRKVELAVTPAAEIRYTTDATNPREGRVYDEPFTIPDDRIMLQVYASAGEAKETETFNIAEKGTQRAEIDDTKTATLKRQKVRFDTTSAVFGLITNFKERQGVIFHGVALNVGEGEQAVQVRFNDRAVTPAILEKVIAALRENLDEPDALVQLTIRDGAAFDTGFDLKAFAELAGIELTPDTVEQ